MRYYIPTSTSNFNCLLADESISPCGFYQKRSFGYRSFAKVPYNNNEAHLPLFVSCPVFELPDDTPGFPLVLEIDSSLINESELRQGSYEGGTIFYIDKTLYFNPFNMRFIFRNQRERIETVNAAQRSIETKLLSWYQGSFASIDSIDKKHTPEFNGQEDFKDDSQEEVKQELLSSDARKNRIKGILWSYTIGANLSRKESAYADLRKHLEIMRGALSAQVGGTKSTNKDSLANLRSDINRILEKAQETIIKAYFKAWEEPDVAFKQMYASCPSERPEIKSTVMEAAGVFQIGPFAGSTIADVNSYIDETIKEITRTIYPPKLIAFDGIPSVSGNQFISLPAGETRPTVERGKDHTDDNVDTSADERRVAAYILNATLAKHAHLFIEDKPSYVYEIARGLGGKCSEQDGPALEQFLRMLYDNLKGAAPLKLNEAPNETMKSFAIFCKKGSMDSLEDLECVLLSNDILDLSFAYALWGAVYGYSAMPKTVIDATLSGYPKEYAEEAMRRIYEEISDKPHFETKTDPWREQKELIIGAWPDLYEIRDTEDSRTASRPKKNWPIEKILKKCNSIDDWEKQVDKTWKKKSDIYQAHIEFINGQRNFNDTQR